MNLVTELDNISWRRFLVLLAGLSPDSVTVLTVRSRNEKKTPDEVIEDEQQAERVFDRW